MNKKEWLEKLKKPKGFLLLLVLVFTLVFSALSIGVQFIAYMGTPFEYFVYLIYALAACFLGYSVYTLVLYLPKAKHKLYSFLQSKRFTKKLLEHYGFRTVIFSCISLFISLLYAAYNLTIACLFPSVWFTALSAYYIFLICLRVGLIAYHNRRRFRVRDQEIEISKYRNCGILLIATISALSFAILKMVQDGAAFDHNGWTIYAAAAYAFYKIGASIYNSLKARRQDDYTVRALRFVNLADGAVSILALQTSLLHTFGNENSAFTAIANAATGAIVCLFVLCLGILMIVSAKKAKQNLSIHSKK